MGDRRRAAVAAARLARPLFLVGGFVLYGLGWSLARADGTALDAAVLVVGQVAVIAGQLATHFANDYFDVEADRHNRTPTRWSGGSRVLPDGRLPARFALRAALAANVVGLAAAALIAWPLGRPLPAILVMAALALGWAYSGPPARLHGTGFGEPAGAVLLAVLTPLLGYRLQADVTVERLSALVPLFWLQLAMLVTVSLPDAGGDRRAGKRTLAVRLGPARAARLAAASLAAAALSLPMVAATRPAVALAVLPAVVPGAWLARALLRRPADRAAWGAMGFVSIALVMGAALAMSAAAVAFSPR